MASHKARRGAGVDEGFKVRIRFRVRIRVRVRVRIRVRMKVREPDRFFVAVIREGHAVKVTCIFA